MINYAIEWKSSDQYPPPVSKFLNAFYVVAMNPVFEWALFGIIIANVLCSIVELSVSNITTLFVLDIFNYFFCAVYLIEALIKVQYIPQLHKCINILQWDHN